MEVRRVNQRMQRMISDEKKPYEQLAVARYVAAVLWEDQGHADDAFIDYAAANQLVGNLGSLAEPLVRLAKETQREQALQELRRQYPWAQPRPLGPDEGQILVVLEAGKVPEKTTGNRNGGPQLGIIAVPHVRDPALVPRQPGGARRRSADPPDDGDLAGAGGEDPPRPPDGFADRPAGRGAGPPRRHRRRSGGGDQERGGGHPDLPRPERGRTSPISGAGCRCPRSSSWCASGSRPACTGWRSSPAAGCASSQIDVRPKRVTLVVLRSY